MIRTTLPTIPNNPLTHHHAPLLPPPTTPSPSREEMRALIETGYVTVDEAVVCDPRHAVQDKDFIEVVVCRRDAETQTKALRGVGVEVEGGVEIGDKGESKSSSSESKHGGGEGEGKGDDGDDYGYDDDFGDDGDGDGGESKGESKSGGGGGGSLDRALESFLGRVAPLVETEVCTDTNTLCQHVHRPHRP